MIDKQAILQAFNFRDQPGASIFRSPLFSQVAEIDDSENNPKPAPLDPIPKK